ncbi:hypothetical protein UMC2_30891 [[Clostridium] sordellii]|uniref:hypothetical protein n=1 Tax=Paraclostridium sordellii TaxID=1505 RepID=UPI0005427C03|nr:hypothetical protein [Paeniclostridium sordellii]CEK36219.1 hypothetical protein UMC2_30891 [[Clostridium] sordellii] [Paeniclostridium sordellii]
MKNKIKALIKRDLIFGFTNNKLQFIFIFLVFMLVTWLYSLNIKTSIIGLGLSPKDVNFIDIFYTVFKGIDYQMPPNLPVFWILINIYITYLIGSYCYDDLSEDSSHIVVRMKSRKYIWISKVIWMITTVIAFYLIILLILAFFSIIMFNISFEWSEYSKTYMMHKVQNNYSGIQFISFTIFIYILTSITMSIIQMLISFMIKPMYIYITNISIIAIGIYSKEFIIPIQGSLILRQNIFDTSYPINPLNSTVYNLVVFVLIFIIGFKYIKKFDMLVSQKTD